LSPDVRRRATIVLSGLLLVLGIAVCVETAVAGGRLGYLFGALLAVAGAGRLYVVFRS
jgi:uncharacterized membrane protein HdeD (DUF308 family)